MDNNAILGLLGESTEVQRLYDGIRSATEAPKFLLHGYAPTHKLLTAGALYARGWPRKARGIMFIITSGAAPAERMHRQLTTLLPADEVLLFPPREVWPHEELHISENINETRMATLQAIALGGPALVIVPIQALAERLVPSTVLRERILTATPGQRLPMDELIAHLVDNGYERVDMVETRRQFSVRGGLIDVFPVAEAHPVRIDFFDDEIDSIRPFDPDTQRSTVSLTEVHIGPGRECPLAVNDDVLTAITETAGRQAAALREAGFDGAAENLTERVQTHLEHLQSQRWVPGLEQYKSFLFPRLHTLLDYAPDAAVVVDEPVRTREQLHLFQSELNETLVNLLEQGRVLPGMASLFSDWDALLHALRPRPVAFTSALERTVPGFERVQRFEVSSKLPETFHGKLDRFIGGVQRARRAGRRVVIVTSTRGRAQRIAEVLKGEAIPVVLGVPGGIAEGSAVFIAEADLAAGCDLPAEDLLILTEFEIFGRTKHARRTVSRARAEGAPVQAADLKVGDFVVHVNHGIGRYSGVETLTVTGVHKDYLLVQYAGDDKLYVPTDQVDLLQKYVGVEGQAPRLNKLGGNEWTRAKQRVQQSVKELAQGLLKLYAEREALPGYAFAPDTVWQQEFEDAFAYEETPDQWRAIDEIKADMERARPMDRLLCGDVGFGKTEVAMRAAFKAVMDTRQVAVLVPTTILAQQHLRTFRERFDNYPVRIESLSRFQSTSEQNRIIAELGKGTVDIIIGTHRLLSKDVQFKDLGCVIVDEEQRFGVAQKERLKELRRTVDVLTLSATPIPRTLHMAMVGVRDMSIIETPPEDRFPIRTYVAEANDELTRAAILRELGRGGQVYFVHNRVQDIERFGRHLRDLVPEARIAIAHGQMHEDALEKVMLDFLHHDVDVLLCSTIIETGMDIANVNTLIVDEADRLGLAQLYQLRGRVGRSNKVAYAYFTYPRDKILSEDAEKRLHAIKEFTELGSGFKIAMRDLEIRGTGNLLGPEQHGFIASIGFELYCKLLEDAVRAVKGEVVEQPPEPVIDLNVDAYVPDGYVSDMQRKVEIYKKVAAVRTTEEGTELQEELEDRFGPMPAPVRNLLVVARIKVLAGQARVEAVSGNDEEIAIRLLRGVSLPQDTALQLSRRFRGRVLLSAARAAPVRLRARGLGQRDVLALLEQVLQEMQTADGVANRMAFTGASGTRAVRRDGA